MPKDDDDRGRKVNTLTQKAPPQRATGTVNKTAPKPMVTAQDRMAKKVERRVTPPPPPAARPVTPAAFPRPTTPPRAPATPVAVPPSMANSEEFKADVERFNNLQNKIMLAAITEDIGDIEDAINAFPANLENIRARGYVFKNYLEKKIDTLANQWRDVRPRVETATQTQLRSLQADAANVQAALNRGARPGAALDSLDSKANSAVSSLQGMYDALDDNVNQTQQQIDDISWSLQQMEQASFGFLPTEGIVEAVPANWKKPDDKDGVEGALLLTDQRLIFEQKEEVATKKVLFITTETKKIQEVQWEVPVVEIAKAIGSTKGFMGKDDYLTIETTNGSPFRSTDIHLKGENGEMWQGFINRVKSGDVAKERTEAVDEKAAEMVANAPTKCSNCGATITQTIMRGQTEISCEFCGSKIRLG